MRYLVGFGALLVALGVCRLVGWGEDPDPCDDGNQCTEGIYNSVMEECRYWDRHEEPCDFDGVPGRCRYKTCVEDLCVNVNCDDGDICSEDHCDFFTTGECYSYNAGLQGETCTRNGLSGVCAGDKCRTFNCPNAVCDDGDPCTDDWCHLNDDQCGSSPKKCGDDNQCTADTCEPETGECVNQPLPDGESCCYRGGTCPGICIPGGCGWCCFERGQCQHGTCVRG